MPLRRLFPCLLFVLLAALPAAAQDATPESTAESSDARAFVLQAIANLNALSGYHFAYTTQTETSLSNASEADTITTVTLTAAEGDALANGDNFTTIAIASAESLELAEATPRLHVERTVFNGKSALNFDLEDSVYESVFPFTDGWQSYEDLSASVEGITTQVLLDNLNNTPIAADFLTFASLIETVTEAAPETVDGVSMRVFDLELNALGLIMQNTPAEQRAGLDDLLKNLDLLALSEQSASARLWIGSEDGQIYRGTIHSTNNVPYFSSGNEDQLPYDFASTYTSDFTISRHGEPIDIEPVIFPD